ncbi:hypothetical protein LEP1GSC170_2503, partial [Leptospira interrogans serovar Bataviae str. HAI135]
MLIAAIEFSTTLAVSNTTDRNILFSSKIQSI